MPIPISIPGLSPNMHAYLFLTLTTLCWAGNAIFSRLAIGEVSPLTLVTFRWISVVALLIVFARKDLRRDWPVLKPKLGYILAMGSIGFTGFNALFYIGAHYTTAVNIGIIQGTIPIFVFVGTFLLFRTAITAKQMAGVFVTLVGIIVVTSGGSLEQLKEMAFNDGDILLVIACILYGGYTVALRFKPDVAALSFFSVLAFAALVSCIPLIGYEIYTETVQMPTVKGWVLIGAIAILPSFLAQILFIYGVSLIGPARAGIFVNLVPIFAPIMAVLFLNEPFQLYHGAALTLVLGGIYLAERSGKSEK
jgi:drug/metabolite transporter (DMT)-like permease